MKSNRHIFRGTSRSTPRLGVDIGRVIIHGDGPDTSFLSTTDELAMNAPAMDGAFASLQRLHERFDGLVWLVSKCGPRIEARSRAWLAHHAFYDQTGIDPANLRFCKKRPEKASICLSIGIDFFVDDRLDVLTAMAGVVEHRFLFGAETSPDSNVEAVPTWDAAERAITAILDVREARETPAARAR